MTAMFRPITIDYLIQFTCTEAWSSIIGIHAPKGSPECLSVCEFNKSVELLPEAIERDGYDVAFGLSSQSRTGGAFSETADWPTRDILQEIANSPAACGLAPPRHLELFATSEGADQLRANELSLNLISGLLISSVSAPVDEALVLVADQSFPGCLNVETTSRHATALLEGLQNIGYVTEDLSCHLLD